MKIASSPPIQDHFRTKTDHMDKEIHQNDQMRDFICVLNYQKTSSTITSHLQNFSVQEVFLNLNKYLREGQTATIIGQEMGALINKSSLVQFESR